MGAQSPHKVFWRVQCFGDMVPFSVLLIYHTCVHGTFTVFHITSLTNKVSTHLYTISLSRSTDFVCTCLFKNCLGARLLLLSV